MVKNENTVACRDEDGARYRIIKSRDNEGNITYALIDHDDEVAVVCRYYPPDELQLLYCGYALRAAVHFMNINGEVIEEDQAHC